MTREIVEAMTEIQFTSELTVELLKSDFDDKWPVVAAWTSTKSGDLTFDQTTESYRKGFLNRLMKDKHGSPFEHMNITYRIQAPIFVWREFHRHRIASYNEESGRYKRLDPLFYRPSLERPLQTIEGSKQMDYVYVPGTDSQKSLLREEFEDVCIAAYEAYENMLENGIIKEVAREILPLNIMSTCVVTMNARALMNFLSLRTRDKRATFPSKPQWEINQVANKMEAFFEKLTPITYEAFNNNGRVAP